MPAQHVQAYRLTCDNPKCTAHHLAFSTHHAKDIPRSDLPLGWTVLVLEGFITDTRKFFCSHECQHEWVVDNPRYAFVEPRTVAKF